MHADDGDRTGKQSLVGAKRQVLRRFGPHLAAGLIQKHLEPTSPARHRSFGE